MVNVTRCSLFLVALSSSALLNIALLGCRDHGTDPLPLPPDTLSNPSMSENFVLCYQKVSSGHWNVFTSGANHMNLSLESGVLDYQNDNDPNWSPDGRYIAFRRSELVGGPSIHVYDLSNGTDTVLTNDGGVASTPPQWTEDGKLFFTYQRPLGASAGTYLMNPDGRGKRKFLDRGSDIFFCRDNYTFVYRDGTSWYKSNLDNTENTYVLNTSPSSDKYITVRDFNSHTGEFLVNTNTIPGVAYAIATFKIETGQLSVLLASDNGYTLSLQRYSPDHTKIVFVESGNAVDYISVLDQGIKRRLVSLVKADPPVRFSYAPMQFSSNSKYVAFTEMVFQNSQTVSWIDELYVVDIVTRGLQHVGEGVAPSWSPTP
jgi:WD40 repeat protein